MSNPVTDDLRASFVTIDATPDGHTIDHHRVAYDRDAFLARLDRSGHPQREFIASFQRGGQFQHPARRAGAPDPVEHP